MSQELKQLSYPQKSIWYTEQRYPGTSIAVISATLKYKGTADLLLLERALNLVLQGNDAMRMRIRIANGQPMQYVAEYVYERFEVLDFSNSDITDLYRWDESVSRTPVFGEDKELYRVFLLKIDENTYGYHVVLHHLIGDAWTMVLIGNEVSRHYEKLLAGETPLPEANPSYMEYLGEEIDYIFSKRYEKDKLFWEKEFEIYPEPTEVKPRRSREQLTEASRKSYVLPQRLCRKISDYTEKSGLTKSAVFLSAIFMYLNRITGKDDIIIGVPVLNRLNSKNKKTMGMFISTAPLRMTVAPECSAYDFAQLVTKKWMQVLRHQRYPIDEIMKDVRDKYSDVDRLYDVVFSYQNAMFDEARGGSSRWHFCGHQNEALSIHVNERDTDGELVINYDYLEDVFFAKDIEAMNDQLILLLEQSMKSPKKVVSTLDMVSKKERELILNGFNNTEQPFPLDKSMFDFFEDAVANIPHEPAVYFGDESLTYGELALRTERLAAQLYSGGVRKGDAVALLLNRSFEMMTAILAVWRIGAAYLPVDPSYPDERIAYMLEHSKSTMLISAKDIRSIARYEGRRIDVDSEADGEPAALPEGLRPGPEDLAYIIYTSGSTGQPKGVMIEHRALVNRINWMQRRYPLAKGDVILQKTTYAFDVSVWELTWWFYAGVSMAFLPPGDEKRPDRLLDAVSKYSVTTMHFVPSMLGAFLDYLQKQRGGEKLKTLRQVFASGEALTVKHCDKFGQYITSACGARLNNLYGPTEAAIDVSYFDCLPGVNYRSIPIGRPIDNIKLYILDKYNNIQPIGVPGELCIGGVGLARGYLNAPELTEERFIQSPFEKGERLYRTGDLARWYPRGDIEYLGRIDRQVKIRGFRIELGDIQHHILQFDGIAEAAVTCRDGSEDTAYLAAYYVAKDSVSEEALRAHLAANLPEYMVPTFLMRVDAIPLTSSGKANPQLLPAPSQKPRDIARILVAPRNSIEDFVLSVWKEVLGKEDISVTDNFFDIGGDSIRAIDLVCKMPADMGVGVLYEHPVLEDFALHCENPESSKILTLLAGSRTAAKNYILCPYGGGNAYVYQELAVSLQKTDPFCGVYSLNLPGHDMRDADAPKFLSVRDTAAMIMLEMGDLIKTEITIYAHCVGSAVGIELTRLLEVSGHPPKALSIGAIQPPSGVGIYGAFFDPWAPVSDRKLLQKLKTLGFSQEVEVGQVHRMLRAFRHDVKMYFRYLNELSKMRANKLSVPIYTIIGDKDTMTNMRNKHSWSDFTSNQHWAICIDGAGHYFTKTHSEQIADVICGRIQEEKLSEAIGKSDFSAG